MPHVTLELSANVVETNLSSLLVEINTLLADMLPTQIAGCKSRVIRHQEYVIADNPPQNAFVHANIRVLKGRSQALLDAVASKIMEKLQTAFNASSKSLNLQFTVEVGELPSIYHKVANS